MNGFLPPDKKFLHRWVSQTKPNSNIAIESISWSGPLVFKTGARGVAPSKGNREVGGKRWHVLTTSWVCDQVWSKTWCLGGDLGDWQLLGEEVTVTIKNAEWEALWVGRVWRERSGGKSRGRGSGKQKVPTRQLYLEQGNKYLYNSVWIFNCENFLTSAFISNKLSFSKLLSGDHALGTDFLG